MACLQVILIGECSSRLNEVLDVALRGTRHIERAHIDPAVDGPILFAVNIGETGINIELYKVLQELRSNPDMLTGRVGGVIVDGVTELYTKTVGRELVQSANLCGCIFPGRPLVEGTGSLYNYTVLAKNSGVNRLDAYKEAARDLVRRIVEYRKPDITRPTLLALHASNRETSNTLTIWGMVRTNLEEYMDIQELTLRNGAIADCIGCAYTTCLHFSEKGHCFYGGVMVEEVYPALEKCDALLLLCPNYNDALSANISAFINRLTALFLKTKFYQKSIFGIVVSGYSGGDIVARQLISGLNMNKTFQLPPRFCMMETANDPGSILRTEGIQERVNAFANSIRMHLMP